MTFSLSSSAFENMQEIPVKYTCAGDDISPPLQWNDVPENTASLVLIVDDPDAPDPKSPQMIWVHWVVYNIPPENRSLLESASSGLLPIGTLQGVNDWKHMGYGGPCPPIGRHRYFFKLYALDSLLPEDKKTKAQVLLAMQGHVIAQSQLIGTFQK